MTQNKTVQINIRTKEDLKTALVKDLAEHNKIGPEISFNSFLVHILKSFLTEQKKK